MRLVFAVFLLVISCALARAEKRSDFLDLSMAELMEMQVSVASLFEESELYVASSVSKVTEEDWKRQGAEKMFDAIAAVPGVYVNDYYHGMMIPTFRGFTNVESYNTFLMLLDGIPLNNYSSASGAYGTPNFALGNLSSIEVIRGPGSALYGAGAFHGVVSMNTWESIEDRYETWVEGGSFGYWQGNARMKHSINKNTSLVSALSIGELNDEGIEDTYHESSAGAPLRHAQVTGEYSNITTSHKLNFYDFSLGLYYSKHDVNDAFGTDEVVSGTVTVFPNGNHSDGVAEMYALKLSHSTEFWGSWEIDTSAYYKKDKLDGSFGIGANAGAPPTGVTFDWKSVDHTAGAQSVVKKAFGGSNTQLIAGASYDYLLVDHLGVKNRNSNDPDVAKGKNRKVLGLIGQLEQRFFDDDIQFIAGGRLDNYSDFGTHISPRTGVIYHTGKNTSLKFLYGHAFRAPSVNEQSDNGAVLGGGDSLDPEEVDTCEAIWMHADANWKYSVSAYFSRIKNSIGFYGTPPAGFLQYGNGGRSRSYGVEMEATYHWHRMMFYGSASFNDAKQESPTDSKRTYGAYPDQIYHLGVEIEPAKRWTFAVNNTIYRGRETNYVGPAVSPSYRDQGPLPVYWRTDLYGSWRPKLNEDRYELYFNIRDLFDRKDLMSSLTSVEAGRNTPGVRFTFGAKVTF